MAIIPTYEGTTYPGLDLNSVTISPSDTDITKITIVPVPVTGIPHIALSYKAEVVLASTALFTTPLFTQTSINPIVITGLSQGVLYKVRVTAYSAAGGTGTSGIKVIENFQIPVGANNASINIAVPGSVAAAGTAGNPSPLNEVSKSLFTIHNTSTSVNGISAAWKSFSEIPSPGAISYYSFGTTLFFDSNITDPNQSAGFAFFVGSGMSSAYVVRIDTTTKSASANTKHEISFMKVIGNKILPLTDTQTSTSAFDGVYGGKAYRIDIKVKSTASSNYITLYINGFRISATDTVNASSTPPVALVPFTNTVGMISFKGTASFDYIYGMSLTETQYAKDSVFNLYSGQFSDNSLKFLYGNKVIDVKTMVAPTNGRVEEFGTIAREIRKINIKYDTRPAYPLYPSTGINQFAKVIGSKISPFGAEVYVLNNSGTFIPLDDSDINSFYIGGKTISKSGVLEYSSDPNNLYTTEEPGVFESMWLQNENDVQNLSDWIKNQWSKRQMIVKLEVFGNPFISVGDVISISYAYHNLSAIKFMVTSVYQSYSEGLTTSIYGRTL